MPQQSQNKTVGKHRLSNYMEELTETMLEGLIVDPEYRGARFSESAKDDIKALALNRLWPMYATTPSGKDFLKKVVVEDKIEQDIIRELKVAIAIVRSHPR